MNVEKMGEKKEMRRMRLGETLYRVYVDFCESFVVEGEKESKKEGPIEK